MKGAEKHAICGHEGEIPFGINHLEIPRLVASSAVLSSHPPVTTTSLNPRLNCFPHPLPSRGLICCPAPANPGQPNSNLLPLKLHFLSPGASVKAPTLMNHLN
ncbi:hypothetical protein CDAR_120771 [Caerostris darwini]|uniref:Uncharacterized protein n=1 Tax=Caerostris darwini TaxID=1538125 RepID=A0AAV4RT25_9ARAC|nr:hypothetical protein CDAR_120771 [Caerostris darwini]